jgi:erythromycin esterase-like protein
MQNVLAYLDKVDPQYAMFLRKGPIDIGFLKADSWLQLGARYTRMGNRKPANFDQYVADILGRLAEKRSDYVALSSEVEHAWAVREATCGKRASEFFRRWPTASPEEVTAIRTSAMVDNVLWVFNEVAKGERLIVWAHNIHASRDYVEVHVPGAPIVASMHPMGQSLNGTLAGKVISVGTTFGRHLEPDSLPLGAPSWSVDAALAAVGKPLFMIDLRGAPAEGPVRTWLDTHKTMRGLGGTTKLVPARAYDVLVFIDEIGRATPTAAARARLESMDRARFSTRTTF